MPCQGILNIFKDRDRSILKTRDDFFVTACHEEALRWIDQWIHSDSQGRGLMIVGEACSGKSHLATIWSQDNDAQYVSYKDLMTKSSQERSRYIEDLWNEKSVMAVDDLHVMAHMNEGGDYCFMNIFNDIKNNRGRLLITSQESSETWSNTQVVRDILSRLQTLHTVNISTPETDLMLNIMLKEFLKYGIPVKEVTVSWLVERMPRSFASVAHATKYLINHALTNKQPVNFAAVKEYQKSQSHL